MAVLSEEKWGLNDNESDVVVLKKIGDIHGWGKAWIIDGVPGTFVSYEDAVTKLQRLGRKRNGSVNAK